MSNYCPCWRCNMEPDEVEMYEEDPDRLHDEMKENLP